VGNMHPDAGRSSFDLHIIAISINKARVVCVPISSALERVVSVKTNINKKVAKILGGIGYIHFITWDKLVTQTKEQVFMTGFICK